MIYQLKQNIIDIWGEDAMQQFFDAGWTKQELVWCEIVEEMPEAEGMKSADMQALQDEYDAFQARNFNVKITITSESDLHNAQLRNVEDPEPAEDFIGKDFNPWVSTGVNPFFNFKINNVEDPEPAEEAIPKDFSEIDEMVEILRDLIASYDKPKPIFDVHGVEIKKGDYIISKSGTLEGFVKQCEISGELYLNSHTQDIRTLQSLGKVEFHIHREYCPTPDVVAINTLMYDIKGHSLREGDYVGATDGTDTIEGVVYKKDGVLWLEDIKLEYLFNMNEYITLCRAYQGE